MKVKIRKEYRRRIRMVLKSELNAINKIEAINTVATPVITYSFNLINWTAEDIKNLDRKTRKLLIKENAPPEVRCRPNVFTKTIRRQRLDTN